MASLTGCTKVRENYPYAPLHNWGWRRKTQRSAKNTHLLESLFCVSAFSEVETVTPELAQSTKREKLNVFVKIEDCSQNMRFVSLSVYYFKRCDDK